MKTYFTLRQFKNMRRTMAMVKFFVTRTLDVYMYQVKGMTSLRTTTLKERSLVVETLRTKQSKSVNFTLFCLVKKRDEQIPV